jgi:hypothetical protein
MAVKSYAASIASIRLNPLVEDLELLSSIPSAPLFIALRFGLAAANILSSSNTPSIDCSRMPSAKHIAGLEDCAVEHSWTPRAVRAADTGGGEERVGGNTCSDEKARLLYVESK